MTLARRSSSTTCSSARTATRLRWRAFAHRRTVAGEIVKHGRDEKIVVFKMKRRKNYAKKQGHRQGFTEVRINDITLG